MRTYRPPGRGWLAGSRRRPHRKGSHRYVRRRLAAHCAARTATLRLVHVSPRARLRALALTTTFANRGVTGRRGCACGSPVAPPVSATATVASRAARTIDAIQRQLREFTVHTAISDQWVPRRAAARADVDTSASALIVRRWA